MRTNMIFLAMATAIFCLVLSAEAFAVGGDSDGSGVKDGGPVNNSVVAAPAKGPSGGAHTSAPARVESHGSPAPARMSAPSHLGSSSGSVHYSGGHPSAPPSVSRPSAPHVGTAAPTHVNTMSSTRRPNNYGSIQHSSTTPNRLPGHYSGGVVEPQGKRVGNTRIPATSSLPARQVPFGANSRVMRGPGSRAPDAARGHQGAVEGFRGFHRGGLVSKLPEGCEALEFHGERFFHRDFEFFRPCWFGGSIFFWPCYPPIGWWCSYLPDYAVVYVVSSNSYYYSDGAYYQQAEENGQTGYKVVEDPTLAQPKAQVQPEAPDPFVVLENMTTYLAKQQQFTLSLTETYDEVAETGPKIQLSSLRTVYLQRPDKVAADFTSDTDRRHIVYDGKNVTAVDLPQKFYGTVALQGPVDSVLDKLANEYGMVLPMEDLLYKDAYTRLADKIQDGQHLGQETVAGNKCDHVAFTQEGIDWQMWIQRGDTPIPRMIVITYRDTAGQPRYTLMVTKFDTSPIPDSAFKVELPAGAAKIDLVPTPQQAPPSK